jgi:hypothetical protein
VHASRTPRHECEDEQSPPDSAGCEHAMSRERKSLHAHLAARNAHTGLGTTLNNECPPGVSMQLRMSVSQRCNMILVTGKLYLEFCEVANSQAWDENAANILLTAETIVQRPWWKEAGRTRSTPTTRILCLRIYHDSKMLSNKGNQWKTLQRIPFPCPKVVTSVLDVWAGSKPSTQSATTHMGVEWRGESRTLLWTRPRGCYTHYQTYTNINLKRNLDSAPHINTLFDWSLPCSQMQHTSGQWDHHVHKREG